MAHSFPPRAFTYTCIIYDLIRQTTVPSACIRTPYTPGGHPDIETARLKPDIDTQARSIRCSNGPARETYTVYVANIHLHTLLLRSYRRNPWPLSGSEAI